jgi:tRNA threonylcarbamoyladenosine biosynthesis protein TsaB
VIILALDTSSPAGSLAVLHDEKHRAVISTSTDEIYSSRMFRHLEFLLRELSLDLGDIDLFAAAAGPGSFTGLRVGLAAVKGWAEVYGKPIAPVSGLEAIAAQSHSGASSSTSLLAPVLDARRGQIYSGLYRRKAGNSALALSLEGEERVMTPDEFSELLAGVDGATDIAIVAAAPGLVAEAVSRYETMHPAARKIRVEEVLPVLAPWIGRIGYLRAQSGEVVDALTLDANYIRRSDAELQWKMPAGR